MSPIIMMPGEIEYNPPMSNLKGWFDFSDITTLYQDEIATSPITANGQVIRRAQDKSGSFAGGATSSATDQYYRTNIQNGLSVCSFNEGTVNARLGGSLAFSANNQQPNTVVCVFEEPPVDGVSRQYIWSSGSGSFRSGLYKDTSATNLTMYAGSAVLTSINNTPGTWHYVLLEFNGASSNVYLDGVAVDTGLNPGTQEINNFFLANYHSIDDGGDFDMGEWLYYEQLLTTQQRNDVHTYCATKWGI